MKKCNGRPLSAKMRHRITVQQLTDVISSSGAPSSTWSNYALRKAKATPTGGQEVFRLQQHFSEANMIFLTRYDSLTKAINTKMRVSFNSRIFDIISVINDEEANETITIVCTEKT